MRVAFSVLRKFNDASQGNFAIPDYATFSAAPLFECGVPMYGNSFRVSV